MSDQWLRVRGLAGRYFAVSVVVLLVLTLLGGWATYAAHAEPGTHVEQRQGSSWSTTADFTHSATVSESNSVYPVGTTLENRSVYYGSIAPILNGTLEYRYGATDGGNLTVATDSTLTLQRVERDRNGEIAARYWETSRTLGQRRSTDVGPGRAVQVPFTVNASALTDRNARISDELGGTTGETEALVHVDVALNGSVNGERVSRTDRYTLPMSVGGIYRISDPGTSSDEFASTRPVTVENSHGPLRSVGAPLLLAASLLALGGLAVARWRDALALTSEEREYLAYRDDREEFDEWINTISLPHGAESLPSAEADSLGDLVDFAIDTNNSVLQDPADGTYHVVHDGYRYVYEPPELPDRGSERPDAAASGADEDPADDADGPDPIASDPRGTDD